MSSNLCHGCWTYTSEGCSPPAAFSVTANAITLTPAEKPLCRVPMLLRLDDAVGLGDSGVHADDRQREKCGSQSMFCAPNGWSSGDVLTFTITVTVMPQLVAAARTLPCPRGYGGITLPARQRDLPQLGA